MATWAGPALVEVQRIRAVQDEFKDAFDLVVLVVDEEPEMAGIFAEKFELTDVIGWVESTDDLVRDEGPFGPIGTLPTSILLDVEGRIAVRSDGPWPPGSLEQSLRALGTP